MKNNAYKHVFLVSSAEVFSPLYLDALIHKVGVYPESICVVVFQADSSLPKKVKEIPNINYVSFDDAADSLFLNASTVTYFSLSRFNSYYVRYVLELRSDMKDKSYMFITDDEVDRWLKCLNRHGEIVADNQFNINENDVWVMKQQCCFIALDDAFRQKLSLVLKGRNYRIVDSGVVFDTLPTNAAKMLLVSVLDCESDKKNTLLLGTKPNAFNYQDVKSMLNSFVTQGVHHNYKFIVFFPLKQWRKRMLLELYLFYLHKIKKQTVDLSIITSLSSLAYTSLVMSCSHLVLQNRGGASTARQLIKWGQGKICLERGSHNELFFKDAQSVELLEYSTFKELAESLDQKVDIQGNALKINEEEQRSIRELAKLYS